MAKLAIKGHKTRGREVIQLLEMLGGVNYYSLGGTMDDCHYYIHNGNKIHHWQGIPIEKVIIYTLEEFEEKFRYKVGDKVTLDKSPCIITGMSWYCDDVIYYVKGTDFSKGVCSTDKDLQPYEEEIMEEKESEPKELIIGFTKDDNGDWTLDIHKDYEIKEIEGKFKAIKKQPQYPKDYVRCCECLGHNPFSNNVSGYKRDVIESLQTLITCRDAFYNNFKELIEQCKELL